METRDKQSWNISLPTFVLWFFRHRLFKLRFQILKSINSWNFPVSVASLTEKTDRNDTSSTSANKGVINFCWIFCYKSSSQRNFILASGIQIPFMHFLPFSVIKQHLSMFYLLEKLPGARFPLAGMLFLLSQKPNSLIKTQCQRTMSSWLLSAQALSASTVSSLPFLLPATSFPVQYKLSQGGQHSMLSPGDKLHFVLFHVKMSKKNHSDRGISLSSLHREMPRKSYRKETSLVVHLTQMALRNSLMKTNKF